MYALLGKMGKSRASPCISTAKSTYIDQITHVSLFAVSTMPPGTAPVLNTRRNTMWVHMCRYISGEAPAPPLLMAPPKVSFFNGHTVVMLANVTAGGCTSMDTIRT